MNKVFIVHGFEGSPNGGWRPWLMGELERRDVYACALPMPTPEQPVRSEWVEEIARAVGRGAPEDACLVGHSLGVPAILRFAATLPVGARLAGVVLVAGPCAPLGKDKIDDFMLEPFDLAALKPKLGRCVVIHGEDDPLVPFAHAEKLANALGAALVPVKNGKHLNGSAGWLTLPPCLAAVTEIMAV